MAAGFDHFYWGGGGGGGGFVVGHQGNRARVCENETCDVIKACMPVVPLGSKDSGGTSRQQGISWHMKTECHVLHFRSNHPEQTGESVHWDQYRYQLVYNNNLHSCRSAVVRLGHTKINVVHTMLRPWQTTIKGESMDPCGNPLTLADTMLDHPN